MRSCVSRVVRLVCPGSPELFQRFVMAKRYAICAGEAGLGHVPKVAACTEAYLVDSQRPGPVAADPGCSQGSTVDELVQLALR